MLTILDPCRIVPPKLLLRQHSSRYIYRAFLYVDARRYLINANDNQDTMEYGHTDLSTFWRGASTQIPESRKALLRRGVDFKYISTLTKEERHSIFYAGHAFINAENASKGLPLICPATVVGINIPYI
jgi:hypothetical protein